MKYIVFTILIISQFAIISTLSEIKNEIHALRIERVR